MNQFKVRSKFSDRVAVIAPEGGESRTQQHFKDEVNINNIIKRYNKTGVISHVQRAQARYGDFTQMADYCENLDMVAKAQQGFEQLPAEVRNHPGIKNSLGNFMEFMKKAENKEQLQKWGFVKADEPKIEPPAQPAEPATPPASELSAPKKTKTK